MRRSNNLAENSLIEEISRLRRDVDDLKRNRQFVGSDSLAVHLNQTSNTWDLSASLPDFTDRQYRVTFTPTRAQRVYADLSYVASVSGGATHRIFPDPAGASSTSSQSWIVALSTSLNPSNVSMKFYVESVDVGTIAVVAL